MRGRAGAGIAMLVAMAMVVPTSASLAAAASVQCVTTTDGLRVDVGTTSDAGLLVDHQRQVTVDVGTGPAACGEAPDGATIEVVGGPGGQTLHVGVAASAVGPASLRLQVDLGDGALGDQGDVVRVHGAQGLANGIGVGPTSVHVSSGPSSTEVVPTSAERLEVIARNGRARLDTGAGRDVDVHLHVREIGAFTQVDGEDISLAAARISYEDVDVGILDLELVRVSAGGVDATWSLPWDLGYAVHMTARPDAPQRVRMTGSPGADRLLLNTFNSSLSAYRWYDGPGDWAAGTGLLGYGEVHLDLDFGPGDDRIEVHTGLGGEHLEGVVNVEGGDGRDRIEVYQDQYVDHVRLADGQLTAGVEGWVEGSLDGDGVPVEKEDSIDRLTGWEVWDLKYIDVAHVDTAGWDTWGEVEVTGVRPVIAHGSDGLAREEPGPMTVDAAGRRVVEGPGVAEIEGFGRVTGWLPTRYLNLGPGSQLLEAPTADGSDRTYDLESYEPVRDLEPAPHGRRIAGGDRIETAAALATTAWWPRADVAVLARWDEYADALAAAPLADAHDAPILLTGPDGLPDATAEALRQLQARQVLIVGGQDAVVPAVETDLAAMGVHVAQRYAGADRFETAALIAQDFSDLNGELTLAEGINTDPRRGWPDALTAATLGVHYGAPTLLLRRDEIPRPTRELLHRSSWITLEVVGGPAAVSDVVLSDLTALGAAHRLPAPVRVAGMNRYETSAEGVLRAFRAGGTARRIILATGENWPDALTAAARVDPETLLLMTDEAVGPTQPWPAADVLVEAARSWPGRFAIEDLVVLGGEAAISDETVVAFLERIRAGGVRFVGG